MVQFPLIAMQDFVKVEFVMRFVRFNVMFPLIPYNAVAFISLRNAETEPLESNSARYFRFLPGVLFATDWELLERFSNGEKVMLSAETAAWIVREPLTNVVASKLIFQCAFE